MNCPFCSSETSFGKTQCENCGQDLTQIKRAVGASNLYYNDALLKARVRDLSGAVLSLKKSLKFNKKNTDARNLLGLVYYEMGEMVEALIQWVLSKNFQPDNNIVDNYLDVVQKSAANLESINHTIKKYNSALSYAKEGKEELAIMQLEKVIASNPKFVRALQLLSLLYMKAGQNKRAAKCLIKANKIDKNNTRTLHYMNELPGTFLTNPDKQKSENHTLNTDSTISPQAFSQGSFKEERFSIWPYVNLLVGAVIGIAVVYFLIVPTAKNSVAVEYEEQFKSYSDELAAQNVAATQMTNEKSKLEKQTAELKKEIETLKEENLDEGIYEDFFQALDLYLAGDKENAAKKLVDIKVSVLESSYAKTIYNKVKEETFEKTSDKIAEEGRVVYNTGKYEDALTLLKGAVKMNPDNTKAIYFIGRTYHRTGKGEKARVYYNKIIENYPDCAQAADAARRLNELGTQ